MLLVAVITLLTFEAHAEELVRRLADKVADNLFDRVLETSSLQHVTLDLDDTTLRKPGHLSNSPHMGLRTIRKPGHFSISPHMGLRTGTSQKIADQSFHFDSSAGQSFHLDSWAGEPLPSHSGNLWRRDALMVSLGVPAALLPLPAIAEKQEMVALKGKNYGKEEMSPKGFTRTPSGLLYKNVKDGNGKAPDKGDRCVVDWSGYTIGYYGRPFETKQLEELDGKNPADAAMRFELGKGSVISGIEEGVAGMTEGGVRQLIVERVALGYPDNDPSHDRVGPKPTTFSGQRALDFVLQNKGMIDKTLLFNVKLLRVDKPGEQGWRGR